MAIPFKLYEGIFTNMANVPLSEGNILFCKDTRQVFVDLTVNGVLGRLQLGSIQEEDGSYIDVKTYVANQLSNFYTKDEIDKLGSGQKTLV